MSIQDFGQRHVFLHGQGRSQYHVHDFHAPISIKTVVRGCAVWRTDEGIFPLVPGQFLIINSRHAYSIDVDSAEPVETFCVFFRDGFVADAARALTTAESRLLDEPSSPREQQFIEAAQRDDAVLDAVTALRNKTRDESALLRLGEAIVRADAHLSRAAARVPATKASTRREILRRILRARDFVNASLERRFTLEEAANAAALSPFHLHRSFRSVFGQTLHQYATAQRLNRAAGLLQHTQLSLAVISSAVGFESATSFANLFRRSFGVTAGQFRAEISKIR